MPVIESVRQRKLSFHFQPIVSIKKHSVIGFEALLRPDSAEAGAVEPRALFEQAAAEAASHELCELCRGQALASYAALESRDPEHLLFINLQADQLGGGRFSVAAFQQLAREHGLKPSQLVLEFGAAEARQAPELRPLAATLQSFGFTIALCDMDLSGQNPALLAALKPDIVKARQDLLPGLERDVARQALLRGLATVAHHQGALCAVVGVENEEQAGACLELGADLLQGYHYGRPGAAPVQALPRAQAAVNLSATRYKAGLAQRSLTRRREAQRHDELMDRLVKALSEVLPSGFGKVLAGFVNAVASLDCLYVLDRHGRQMTETVVWRHQAADERNSLFAPAREGADHSLKDYFLGLELSDKDLFVSEPYVSLATGNLCRTLAERFKAADGSDAIVCMDIRSL